MTTHVQRVPRLTDRDVDDAIRADQPMIATDMLRSWAASSLWSFDFLKEQYGSDVVSLSDGRFQTLAELPLGHCLDFFSRVDLGDTHRLLGATPYIQDWLLLDQHPELYEHIEVPGWFRNWERSLMKLLRPGRPYHDIVALAGPAGATTFLHRDRFRTHAWLAQIVGRKKWTLFPPDQYALLFRDPEPGAQAAVNIDDPDEDRFPHFGRATPIEVVLHPGEMILVPAGWLHQVTSLDPSISVTGNWVNAANFSLFVRDAVALQVEQARERRQPAPPALVDALTRSINAATGLAPTLSTSGGTSDGRFLTRVAREVVEFGPVGESIHGVDERVRLADIGPLSSIYEQTVTTLLAR